MAGILLSMWKSRYSNCRALLPSICPAKHWCCYHWEVTSTDHDLEWCGRPGLVFPLRRGPQHRKLRWWKEAGRSMWGMLEGRQKRVRQELPVLSSSLSHQVTAHHLTSVLPCPWVCASVHCGHLLCSMCCYQTHASRGRKYNWLSLASSNLLHMQTPTQHLISSGFKLLPCST